MVHVHIHIHISCYAMYNTAVKEWWLFSDIYSSENPPLFHHSPTVKLLLTDCWSPLASEGGNLEKVTLLKEKLHACLSILRAQ